LRYKFRRIELLAAVDMDEKQVNQDNNEDVVDTMKNRNVRLALLFTFLGSASRGVWAFVILSNFIHALTGSTLSVGFAEGIQGFSQCIFALVAGVAADKFSREFSLRLAGAFGLIACGVAIFSLKYQETWLTDQYRYYFVIAFLCFWGAYQGIWTTSLETIFADSIATGKRSQFSTQKFILLQIASITGPVIGILLFFYQGNHWKYNILNDIFFIGILLSLPSVFILFLFRDKYTLGELSESHASPLQSPLINDEDVGNVNKDDHFKIGYNYINNNVGNNNKVGRIPYILAIADIISGISAGMTVKFFPLFFANDLKLTPIYTNGIYVGLPIAMSIMAHGGQFVARRYFGRVFTIIFMSIGGAFALIGLWAIEKYAGESTPINVKIIVYVLSTLQHCVRPLKKSLLMDFVPKKRRGIWNAVDSVTRFGWSGSAILGGWIISSYGYGASFLYTGILQFLAAVFLFCLIPLVPNNDNERHREASVDSYESVDDSLRTTSDTAATGW